MFVCKMKELIIITALLLLANLGFSQVKFEDGIDEIFSRMELLGINTNEKLLFGYFFISENKKSLLELWKVLEKNEISLVKIEEIEVGEGIEFYMHVEKIENKTRENLRKTSIDFVELAEQFNTEYDGWDVGNIDATQPLFNVEEYKSFLNSLTNGNLFRNSIDLYDLKEYENAILGFEKCIEKRFKEDTSMFKLANCEAYLGNNEQAITQFKEVLKFNPNYEYAAFNVAATSYELGDYKTTETYYLKVLEMNPKNDLAYYGLAAVEYVRKDFRKALINCEKALKINPKNENALNLIKMIKK